MLSFDLREVFTRLMKYLVEGLAVGLAVALIPRKHAPSMDEIILIGLVAASVFAVLDLFSPSIGSSIRHGAGLGLGANLVGFPAL